MGYGFWDGVLDVFSGGAYSATRAATSAATHVAGQAIGTVAPAIGQAFGAIGNEIGQTTSAPHAGPAQASTTAGASGNIYGTLSGTVSGTVSGPANNFITNQESKCCCYVIDGDYLLNSGTGQVWLIDKENKELLPIRRILLPLESAASALNLDSMKQFLLEQKDSELANLHYSVRDGFSKKVDTLIGALDKEIAISVKASKP